MLKLSSPKGVSLLVVGVVVLLAATAYINGFIYPFTSVKPNFADVHAVYTRMQVPGDWVKQGEGANKGIAGRQCGVESNGCFSQSATFNVPTSTTTDVIKNVYLGMGCVSVSVDRTEEKDGPTSTKFICSAGGVILSGSLLERNTNWEIYINAGSH